MSEKALSTTTTVIAFALGLLGLGMCIAMMVQESDGAVSSALYLTYVMMAVSVGAALLFGLFQFLTNIKNNISVLIGLVFFAVLLLIAYNIGDSTVLPNYVEGTTPADALWADVGLYFTYVLGGIAVVAAIGGELYRLVK